MNRLILVGNGFDLAHKMKTSYKDFVLAYFNQAFIECENGVEYADTLMTVKKTGVRFPNYKPFTGTDDITHFRQFLGRENFPGIYVSGQRQEHMIEAYPFKLHILNPFIKKLFLHCCDYNWVDIENEYYRELKDVLIIKTPKDKSEALKKLNTAFQTLSEKLQDYLRRLATPEFSDLFLNVFVDKIEQNEVVIDKLTDDIRPSKYLVLNFNYTSTVDKYIMDLKRKYEIDINYIHGRLHFKRNPVIFGFGDEHDEDYPRLEKETDPNFLTYMKSFWYFKTRNYHELIRFIEADSFQVVIAGHSCGLSDRTMLKMILEHANCKSVKIYYYQNGDWNNYGILTQELSRHFSNKSDMRKKIVPLPFCSPLPQVSMSLLTQK